MGAAAHTRAVPALGARGAGLGHARSPASSRCTASTGSSATTTASSRKRRHGERTVRAPSRGDRASRALIALQATRQHMSTWLTPGFVRGMALAMMRRRSLAGGSHDTAERRTRRRPRSRAWPRCQRAPQQQAAASPHPAGPRPRSWRGDAGPGRRARAVFARAGARGAGRRRTPPRAAPRAATPRPAAAASAAAVAATASSASRRAEPIDIPAARSGASRDGGAASRRPSVKPGGAASIPAGTELQLVLETACSRRRRRRSATR